MAKDCRLENEDKEWQKNTSIDPNDEIISKEQKNISIDPNDEITTKEQKITSIDPNDEI